MMRFSFVLMLVVYTSVATGIAFAQNEIASVGTIRGTVIDTSREENPIEDARVEITAASSEGEITTLEVFTNANGEFEKEDIEPGRYFANTYKDKYRDRIGRGVTIAAGSDNVIKIK